MIKKNELVLLSHLRKNARETLTKISRDTRIPVSTIFDRLKKYDNDLIKKSTILLDFSKLGYSTRVSLMLKVAKNQREKVKDFLIKENRVNSFYRVNNNFDFIMEGIFINMQEFQDFVEDLEEKFDIREKQMFYILEDIKKEEFMSNPNSLALKIG
ncbi:Lrp/AsnC family transcriptional regulator [Candidatus Woesearchaeota archaeon]|nr:Lrp/AsnC family transcriptional regulator [Candidatus Woesearchaeota archaeon]